MRLNFRKKIFLSFLFIALTVMLPIVSIAQEVDSGFNFDEIKFSNGSGFKVVSEGVAPNQVFFLQALKPIQLSNGQLVDSLFDIQKKFLEDKLAGSIMGFAGPTANIPEGWLVCDGQEVATADHAVLYDRIGDTWGTPSNEFVFKLPDLRGHFLRGVAISGSPGDTASPNRTLATVQESTFKFPSNTLPSSTGTAAAHSHEYHDIVVAADPSHPASGTGVGTVTHGAVGTTTGTFIDNLLGSTTVSFRATDLTNSVTATARRPIASASNVTEADDFTHTHSLTTQLDTVFDQETRPQNYPVTYCIKH